MGTRHHNRGTMHSVTSYCLELRNAGMQRQALAGRVVSSTQCIQCVRKDCRNDRSLKLVYVGDAGKLKKQCKLRMLSKVN